MKNSDLLIAANTIWVVVAAVLVMFMQAGFAFLEAGLTRMKNAGAHRRQERPHLRRLLARLLGRRLRDRLRRRRPASSARRVLPVGRLDARRRPGAVLVLHDVPGAAGYMFEVVFAGVSLAIVWGAMAERAKLWVYFVFGALFTLIYSVVSHWIWGRRLALRARDAGLRRLDGRALPGCARGSRRGAAARAADRQVRHGRPRERDPRAQHPVRRPRHAHPLVRLVRLQPRLDPRRSITATIGFFAYVALTTNLAAAAGAVSGAITRLARAPQARHLDDAERRARRARRDHRGVGLRRAVGGGRDRRSSRA